MEAILFGRTKFANDCLKQLKQNGYSVLFVPSKPQVNEEIEIEKENIALANSFGFKVITLTDFNTEFKLNKITRPDFIFSALHNAIFKNDLISFPKRGMVNFHASPTPPIRGVAGYTQAYLHKMNYWGATSFFIVDEGIDNGPIIIRKTFEFDCLSGTAFDLRTKTYPVLLEVMKETIQVLKSDNFKAAPQPEEYLYLSKKQFEENKIVDTTTSSEEIDNKIRAYWFPPYEGATIILDGKRYTLVNEEIIKSLVNT